MEAIKNIQNQANNKLLGENNVVASNYVIVMSIFLVIVIITILFFLSKGFRTSRAVDTIKMYHKYQTIHSLSVKTNNIKLCNSYISSSYNPTIVNYQMFDYTSSSVLKAILRSGVRYLDMSIFNSKYGKNAYPLVTNGYRVGEWKMAINSVSFEECCKVIAENAFLPSGEEGKGVPNYNDPLFIGLNLKTNNNIYCLDTMAEIIVDYFRSRLVDHKYSYQQNNIAEAKMSELRGKVVFLASTGYEGSKLDEIINGSWDKPNIKRIHYSELTNTEFNMKKMIDYNKKNLTIVVPHKEGDFWSSNYNTEVAFNTGCQFIAMNYQVIDKHMDSYITKFKQKGIIFKPRYMTK